MNAPASGARRAAIVGAGPAGSAVSEILSASGIAHDLYDEQPRAGGNIGRRRFDAPTAAPEGAGHSTSCQTVVSSLVLEGVFERFPKLKVVMIEGGFAWLPSLSWRLDRLFDRMRAEVRHLRRRPSEYIRDHIWLTTQPMEEPESRQHLNETMSAVGWDRLLFASDYPHWDFDDPFRAFPASVPRDRTREILSLNARSVFRLG